MPLPAPLRSLQADLPACPRVLLELQTLMRDDERALPEIAAVTETPESRTISICLSTS